MAGYVVLYQHVVFKYGDLVEPVFFAHDHLAVHAFAAGQEFCFGHDRATASGGAPFTAALTLGF